jgi:hypothetical protein
MPRSGFIEAGAMFLRKMTVPAEGIGIFSGTENGYFLRRRKNGKLRPLERGL